MSTDLIRTPEYNVYWEQDGETEFDPWVPREEAEARLKEIYADPETFKLLDVENDPENLPYVKESVFLVRRWIVSFTDDDWDYLRDEKAEEDIDDERHLKDEMRLAGFGD
jgi:hypothetical protein